MANMKNNFCFLSGEDGTALSISCSRVVMAVFLLLQMLHQDYAQILHLAWRNKDIHKAQELKFKIS